MVLASQHAHGYVIPAALRRLLPELIVRKAEKHFVFEITSTITVLHGTENW